MVDMMRSTVSGICRILRLIVLLPIWTTSNAQVNYGGQCLTPDDQQGECISLVTCEPLRALLTQGNLTQSTVNFLRQSHCGYVEASSGQDFDLKTPPATEEKTFVTTIGSRSCTENKRSTDPTRGNRPLVCCPLPATDRPPFSEEDLRPEDHGVDYTQHPSWKLLMPDICGADVSDKIIGGQMANLKQYPWLALMQYQTRYGKQFLCGGALIGNRYVLTAAHCVKGLGDTKLLTVRLGEQNTETDPDCMDLKTGRVCGEPVQVFKIAKVIPHPQYRPNSRDKHHDIALIRLDRAATITDYIVPICLPTGPAVKKRYETEAMVVAGWGRTKDTFTSPVKMWVRVPVVTRDACQDIYQGETTLIPDQMCAGGQRGKDSCKGDSGGPLMTVEMIPGRRGAQWTAVGVVSRGPKYCGYSGRPGIYTRVGAYMQWILDTLKP